MLRNALFAGSFDPPSLGHLDIIQRASKLVDRLIIGVAANLKKGNGLLSFDERVKLLQTITKSIPNVEIATYEGLTVDFAKSRGVTQLIRGLRLTSTVQEEFQIALANRKLMNVETLFILGDERYSHISSTIIREIFKAKGSLKELVPQEVEALLKSKVTF